MLLVVLVVLNVSMLYLAFVPPVPLVACAALSLFDLIWTRQATVNDSMIC